MRPLLEATGLVAGRRLRSGLLARADQPGRRAPTPGHAQDRRRGHAARHASSPRCSTARSSTRSCRDVVAPRGRDGQADREHVPAGQHRPRQRAGHHRPVDRRRHLGGTRGGGHQAVRLHAVLARPRCGRPLHRHRPELPVLEGGAAPRLRDRVRRARPGRQQPDARARRQPHRRRPQRRRARPCGAPASSSSASPTRPASTTCGSRRRSTCCSACRRRRRLRLPRPVRAVRRRRRPPARRLREGRARRPPARRCPAARRYR